MKIRIAALVTALVSSLLAGVPAQALDSSQCVTTQKDFTLAGFDYLCDVELLEPDLASDRRQLIYRPDYDDYVFWAKDEVIQTGMALYSTSLTPQTTFKHVDRVNKALNTSIRFENREGVDSISWVRKNFDAIYWSLSGYEHSKVDAHVWTPTYSTNLNSEVYYWGEWRGSGTFPVTLQNGDVFSFPYSKDYVNVPQIALQATTGTGYSAWVIDRTATANRILAYGAATPDASLAGGTQVLSYPTSTDIIGLDFDGETYSMLVVESASTGVVQLRTIDRFGTVTIGSATPRFGTITNMVATPVGTYVEFATNEDATTRKLVFLPKERVFPRVVAENAVWSVSDFGLAIWAEQTSAGGYVLKEFSPDTLSATVTSKLPGPSQAEPIVSYLRDGRVFLSITGVGSFVGRPSGASPSPSVDTSKLQSWYDVNSKLELTGTDLQSIVGRDCTLEEGSCQLVMDEATNSYKLRLSHPVWTPDVSLSLQFQTSESETVTETVNYKVRKAIRATLESDTVGAGAEIVVNGISLDLIENVTFGPSANFVNPNVQFEQTTGSITVSTAADAASGEYTLKLLHPDQRGASYPWQSIDLNVTISSQTPVFTSIRDNENTIAGEWVRIDGSNLSVVTGIRADGRDLVIEVQDDNSITFVAPIFPTAGVFPITAVTADGEVETGFNFVMTTEPVITGSGPNTDLSPGDTVRLDGVNLDRLTSVTVGGIQVTATQTEGDSWFFKLPAALGVGEHAVMASWEGGDVPTDVTFTIGAAAAAPGGDNGEFSVWTKKISDTEIKMYAKNPIGAGKVVFKVNGEEYAWIRATSANDRKLRVVTEGPMAGVSYLVRTITLEPGKNALEFYLDGERIRRNTYSLR